MKNTDFLNTDILPQYNCSNCGYCVSNGDERICERFISQSMSIKHCFLNNFRYHSKKTI